jgi:hypothetical protein
MACGVANSGSSKKYKALKRREFITLLGGICTTLGAVGVRAAETSAKRAVYPSDANDVVDGAHSFASRCHRVADIRRIEMLLVDGFDLRDAAVLDRKCACLALA